MTMGLEIKIDADAAKEVVKQAILEQLGDEGRARLIENALTFLLTEPPRSSYGTQQPSPLQVAFNDAARLAANEIVREHVAKDPAFIAKVHEKVGEAMALVDEANYSNYVADALGEALRKARG